MTEQRFNRAMDRRPERGRYAPKRKVCAFCVSRAKVIDYKDFENLRGFMSNRAKIEPGRRTGTCAKHQRALAVALKRARHLALLPFVPSHVRSFSEIGREKTV